MVAGAETLRADFATDPSGTGVFRTMKRMKLLSMLGVLGGRGLVMPTMRAQRAAADPAAAQTVNGHREFIPLPSEGTEEDLGAPQMEQR